jgi:hypothetical protein
MKSHPTEFFPEGASAEDAEASTQSETEKLSDAEKYAAQTRKNRQAQDYSALQGALDSVVTGTKAILSGLVAAVESISDLLNLGDEGSKVVILGILVLALVGSNIYTYVAYRPSSEAKYLRKYRRTGGQEGDLSDAVRLLLQNANQGYGQSGRVLPPKEEAEEIGKILDQVEKRTEALRTALKSSRGGEGAIAGLD